MALIDLVTLTLTGLALLAGESGAWLNQFDGSLNFQCPEGQFLAHVNSEHSNHQEDRVWDLQCRVMPVEGSATNCHWTNYVNEFDQPVTYQCPGEGYIAGMSSVHDNHAEDRRFKYQCCEIPEVIAHGCYFTDWENEFDHILDYIVPPGKVMRGMDSYHNNHHEDRRFKFEICDYKNI